MGNLRACFAVAMLALAACGSDKATPDASITLIDGPPVDMKIWEDAPPPMFDLTCNGNSAPTDATATVTVSGTAQEVGFDLTQNPPLSLTDLEDATVTACNAAATDCVDEDSYGTATTDATGAFSIGPIDTGMAPLDAYVEMTKTGVRTLYTYPPQPLLADQAGIPMLTYAPSLVGLLGQLPNGCTQNDDDNGMILVAFVDCANAPISDSQNITISIKQNDAEVQGTTVVDLSDLQSALAGTFLICNVPEGATTTVGGSYTTTTLRAHDVRVVKGTTTATIVRPGY